MSRTVNAAMIGLGFGAEFIPIYQAHPNANVKAICRRNPDELNKSGDQFGIDSRYTSYDDVLADPEIDFVHINSPIPDHAWMSLKALDAGKHVMCTVPMATTVDECRQIVEKVKATGPEVHDGRDGGVQPRIPVHQADLYDSRVNSARSNTLAASHPQDMDGWPSYWEEDDSDALRHPRGQPLSWAGRWVWRSTSAVLDREQCAKISRKSLAIPICCGNLSHQGQGYSDLDRSHLAVPVRRGSSVPRELSTSTERRRASSGR